MNNVETNLLLCECSSTEHQMVISYFNDDIDPMVYVSVNLVGQGFWGRIKTAIKHIFGYKSKYGAYDEIILGPQHIEKLAAVINHIKMVEAKKLQLNLFDNESTRIH